MAASSGKPFLSLLAAALLVASPIAVVAEMPKSEIPGASPAGTDDPKQAPANRRTPTPKIDPNFPKPEPVAPKEHPSDAPNLPGSGRQDAVPGS